MCKHMTDVYFAPIEVNRDNQAVLVAGDVKHDEFSDFIGRWKSVAQGRETAKLSLLHDFEPATQCLLTVGMLRPKHPEGFP